MDYKRIKKKWVEVVEVGPLEKYHLKPGQRIIAQQILHNVVELKRPMPTEPITYRERIPDYKVVIVLECVEYENERV